MPRVCSFLLTGLFFAALARAGEEPVVSMRDQVGKILEGAEASGQDGVEAYEKRWLELWSENSPELLFVHSQSRSHTESIERDWLSGRAPLSGKWRMEAMAEREFFCLNERNSGERREADLTLVEMRGVWVRDPAFRAWVGGEVHDGSADGGGVEAGMDWLPLSGLEARLEAWTGRAWDETTDSVRQDGDVDGLSGSLGWQLMKRMTFTLDGAIGWYSLGDEATADERDAGRRMEGGLRADAALWRRTDSSVSAGFLDRRAAGDEGLETGFFAYASARREIHAAPHDFTAVAVVEESNDRRLGCEWRQPFGRWFGATAGAYLGQDQERSVAWPHLYGAQARVFAFPAGRARLWAGWELASESGTATGGRTATVEWGMNVQF